SSSRCHSHTYHDHHPFPTRRSSDLCEDGGAARSPPPFERRRCRRHRRGEVRKGGAAPLRGNRMPRPPPQGSDAVRTAALRDLPRSEEHTSELQSRGHLVCRLLLEKK